MKSSFVEAVALFEAAQTEAAVRGKLKFLEQAEAAFQKIIDRNPSADPAVTESEAARSTYASVVSQALVIAQTITDEGVFEENEKGVQALVDIAAAQAQSGDGAGAQESFSRALGMARTISKGPRLLADIAEAQARFGDRVCALEIFTQAVALAQTREKEREDFSREIGTSRSHIEDYVDELAYVAEAQARSGIGAGAQENFSIAIAMLRTNTSVWQGIEALADISEAQTRALLDIAEADGTVQAAVAARAITNEWRKAALLGPMWFNPFSRGRENQDFEANKQIVALMRIAAEQRAPTSEIIQALAQMSTDKWEQVRVLGAIGEGQARAGNHTAAKESFSQAFRVSRGITHKGWLWFPAIGIFLTKLVILKILRYDGWEAQALADITEVQSRSLVHLAGKKAESSDTKHPEAVERTIGHDRGWRARVIRRILRSIVIGSRDFSDREARAGAMVDIALAQVRAGDQSGAQETATRTLKLAQRISNEGKRAWVLARVAEVQALVGDLSCARCTAKQALVTTQMITDGERRAGMLAALVKVQIDVGDFDKAVEIARTIDGENMRQRLLAHIAKAQALAGDITRAVEITRAIEDENMREGAFADITKVRAQTGAIVQAFALAQTITDKKQKVKSLLAIGKELAKVGSTTQLQELTQTLAVKEQQVRKLAIVATGRVADWSTYECVIDHALTLVLDELESGYRAKDQVDCLVDIARVQAQAGDRAGAQANFSLAVTAAEALPEEDHYEGWNRLEVLSDIAKAQAEVGEIARAMALVQTFTPRLLQAKPMTKIAQTQAEAGDRAGALETLSKAQSLVQTIADKEYRDTLLADIAEEQAKTGDIAQAQRVARTIKDENRRNSLLADIAVAEAKAKALEGDRAGARESFSEAGKTAQTLSEGWTHVGKCRYEALSQIATAQAETGDIKPAVELARTINDEDVQNHVLVDIAVAEAKALAREGDHAGARESFSQAVAAAQKLPESEYGVGGRNQALADIGISQAATGDVEPAVAVARTITDKEYGDGVFADIANAQTRTGGIAQAQMVAQTITDENSRDWVLANIAVAQAKRYAQGGDRAGARRSFSHAVTLAETISDTVQQNWARVTISSAQTQTGDIAQAIALAETISGKEMQSRVLVNIAEAHAKSAGLFGQAALPSP